MAIYTLPADSGLNFTSGLDQIAIYISQQVPIFFPTLLFAFFMIIFLGGFSLQRRTEGFGDIAQWFSIAGFLTSILALLLSIIKGLIPIQIVLIIISIAILGSIWFLTGKERG